MPEKPIITAWDRAMMHIRSEIAQHNSCVCPVDSYRYEVAVHSLNQDNFNTVVNETMAVITPR